MNDLKFGRYLSKVVKDRYINMTIHIVDCLVKSLETADEAIEPEQRDLALSMYALYLKPYDDIVRNHPRYHEFETLYEEAVRCLPESDLECPCTVCKPDETIDHATNA